MIEIVVGGLIYLALMYVLFDFGNQRKDKWKTSVFKFLVLYVPIISVGITALYLSNTMPYMIFVGILAMVVIYFQFQIIEEQAKQDKFVRFIFAFTPIWVIYWLEKIR